MFNQLLYTIIIAEFVKIQNEILYHISKIYNNLKNKKLIFSLNI